MNYVVGALSIWVFLQTFGYAIFEQKENDNHISAIIIYILSFLCLLVPNIVMHYIK